MPQVSVIIPTYNRRDLVQQAIDSVIRQTFRDWELIVVDDGSTDDTGGVLRERYGSRIRYVRQENSGESAARNHGLALARGEFVAFLDSDDLWLPTKLQRQIDVFASYPRAGLVSTQVYWMNHEGLRLKQPPHGHDLGREVISWDDLVRDNVVAGGGSAAMVRRSCLERVGGFDPAIRFGEEWDVWLRLARHYEVRQIGEPLGLYRLHRFGTRGWAPRPSDAERMYAEHLAILDKAFADPPYEGPRCEALRGEAVSRILLRHAIVDCLLGNTVAGRERWSAAIRLCPHHAADPETVGRQIVHFVTGYAIVAEPGSRIAGIPPMVNRILDNLPSPLEQLAGRREALLAQCFAEMAHLAAANRAAGLARRAAYCCLVTDVTWRKNRGLLKILLTGGRHLWPEPVWI